MEPLCTHAHVAFRRILHAIHAMPYHYHACQVLFCLFHGMHAMFVTTLHSDSRLLLLLCCLLLLLHVTRKKALPCLLLFHACLSAGMLLPPFSKYTDYEAFTFQHGRRLFVKVQGCCCLE